MTIGCPLVPFHIKRGTGWLTAQLQAIDGGWAKCVKICLEQRGEDIVGWIVYAKYLGTGSYGVNFDDQGNDQTVSLADDAYGFGVTSVKITLSTTTGSAIRATCPIRVPDGLGSITMFFDAIDEDLDLSSSVTTAFTTNNGMTVATIVQNGGIATVSHLDGLPVSGTYTVNGGELVLQTSGAAIGRGVSYGRTVIRVVNGVLSQKAPNMLDGARQEVFLDNSELRLLPNMSSGRADILDSDTYVNRLTLKNGSRVTTKWPRIGYNSSANWTVRGTSSS